MYRDPKLASLHPRPTDDASVLGSGGMGTTMDELLWELLAVETNERGLPPGFRFHPTDEELVAYYLAAKVFNGGFTGVGMMEIDLNRCEPWELPDEAKLGEREWYFYSLRDRKYPTGLRTNRATGAGYWKATGKDREVYNTVTGALVGMKKTLVFYKGRAPRGEKTTWVLHEYRLEGDHYFSSRHVSTKEEWVICRIFYKAGGGERKISHFFQQEISRYPQEPSSPPPPTLAPLPEMQTLDSQIEVLLRNQHPQCCMFLKDDDRHHLPPVNDLNLPQCLNIPMSSSSSSKSDFHHHPQSSEQQCSSLPPPEEAFFNLVDADPQDPALVLGMLPSALLGVSFAGEAFHDSPSCLVDAAAGCLGPEPRPLTAGDCSAHAQMWQWQL